ncbi:unnamed protein product [Paramecium sonneborni]|uniref:Uncharacterized protein n=1 Tax=Paramecium sonneborni TaxID=65129 RepID=A0A8S1ND86_9CILI|nr:unnamed protein product [Paramecium sonneborni]
MLQTNDLLCGNRYHYSGLIDAIFQIYKQEKQIQQNTYIDQRDCMLDHQQWHSELDQDQQFNYLFLILLKNMDNNGSKIKLNQICLVVQMQLYGYVLLTCPIEVALTRYFNQQFDKIIIQNLFIEIQLFIKVVSIPLNQSLNQKAFKSGPQSFISLLIVNQLNSLRNQKKQ